MTVPTGNYRINGTGCDTISSGWKNALVNEQAYKSFLGVARMMENIGEKLWQRTTASGQCGCAALTTRLSTIRRRTAISGG